MSGCFVKTRRTWRKPLVIIESTGRDLFPTPGGQSHPTLNSGQTSIFWSRVLHGVVANAYLPLETWNDLHEQVVKLQSLQEKYSAQILIDKNLPEDYLDALLKFQFYLEQNMNGLIAVLKQSAVASPPLRRFFARAPQQPGTTKMQVMSKPNLPPDRVRTRLLWLFSTLWDEHKRLLLGVENLIEETERLIQSEPKAKELVSPYIASVLGDLSILTECLRQIKIYKPWA